MRDIISKGSPVEQLQYEMKAQTKEDREAILDLAMSDGAALEIPADQVLAMKADLSLTWNKLRSIRRYIHAYIIGIYPIETKTTSLYRLLGCILGCITAYNRWMKAWKIHLDSEVKERLLAKELVGPNLASEMVAFSFKLDEGGVEIRKAPMAYVPNLVQKVTQILDQNDR